MPWTKWFSNDKFKDDALFDAIQADPAQFIILYGVSKNTEIAAEMAAEHIAVSGEWITAPLKLSYEISDKATFFSDYLGRYVFSITVDRDSITKLKSSKEYVLFAQNAIRDVLNDFNRKRILFVCNDATAIRRLFDFVPSLYIRWEDSFQVYDTSEW